MVTTIISGYQIAIRENVPVWPFCQAVIWWTGQDGEAKKVAEMPPCLIERRAIKKARTYIVALMVAELKFGSDWMDVVGGVMKPRPQRGVPCASVQPLPEDSRYLPYHCSLDRHRTGDHEADIDGQVVARWSR